MVDSIPWVDRDWRKVHAAAARDHWTQRITFATETNVADTHTAWRRASQYLRSLTGGECKYLCLPDLKSVQLYRTAVCW